MMGLEAREISVCRGDRLILENVSVTIKYNTLTAIIGPNGAGKTTFMRALTGVKPDGGSVFVDGDDIYANPEYWFRKMGYVPDESILHPHLTLYDAMMYIGLLRLPDLSKEKIRARVDHLLEEFGFPLHDPRRGKMISTLSKGETKRANICSELILDPKILFLDEPTSNLDPNAEFGLMTLLKGYSKKYQKTIVVITHTLNMIHLCDHVLYIENSKLVAQGSPINVLEELENRLGLGAQNKKLSNFARWALVFEHTKTRPEARIDCASLQNVKKGNRVVSPHSSSVSIPWWDQLGYLLKRYSLVRWGDKVGLVGTLLAGLSGILFFVLPDKTFINPFDVTERALAINQARQSIYVISLVVALLGMITSYTEVSKEFHIYLHERKKGLSPSAYFFSKWVWLTGAVGILAPILLVLIIIVVYRQPLPDFAIPRIGQEIGYWESIVNFQIPSFFQSQMGRLFLVTLIFCSITSVSIGLLISCISGGNDRGYLLLSFAVVFVILFSGLIRNPRLQEYIDLLSFMSTGKWAYEGISSTVGIYCWIDSWRLDEFNSLGHLLSTWISMALFTSFSGILSIVILHIRDPWKDPWANIRILWTRDWKKILIVVSLVVVLFSYAFFLRKMSEEYHVLNYWSRSEYGGTNAYSYASIEKASGANWLEQTLGQISQARCGVE